MTRPERRPVDLGPVPADPAAVAKAAAVLHTDGQRLRDAWAAAVAICAPKT